MTEKLRNVDVNDKISIRRVLMLGSRHETIIGRPLVPGAFVTAAIEVGGTSLPTSMSGDSCMLVREEVEQDAVRKMCRGKMS